MIVYYGTAWKWPIPYLPRVMLSVSTIRNLKTVWKIDKPWMMDSGIGGMFKEGSRPRITMEEYESILGKWKPPIAWTYDYPCEPSIRGRYNYTIKQAQDWTIESTIKLRDKFDFIQPVVQGWKTEDYLDHIDAFRGQGLLTGMLGIGSICRRGQISRIAGIIREIKRNVPGWVRLHGFGVKTSVLQTDARYNLYSSDSMAWGIERRYYSWTENSNRGLTWQDKVPHLLSYVTKIEKLCIDRPGESLMIYDNDKSGTVIEK